MLRRIAAILIVLLAGAAFAWALWPRPLEVETAVIASHDIAVAVRSSATAEDLPDASFAGQQETFLNVVGIDDVLRRACWMCVCAGPPRPLPHQPAPALTLQRRT